MIVFVLCFLLVYVSAESNETAPNTLELVNIGYYYYFSTCIADYGDRMLLFDTMTPLLLIRSATSERNDQVFATSNLKLYSDLSVVTVSLREPWKRKIQIYNQIMNETFEFTGEDVYPYIMLSHENDIIIPSIGDWRSYADGVFGLGSLNENSLRGPRTAFYKSAKIYSYGFLFDDVNPRVDINHFDEDYEDSIIWADKMTDKSLSISSYYFHLYEFKVCGHQLLGSFSTHYPAVISTASRCLTVPMEVFNNMMGWLPLVCPMNGQGGKSHLCYLGEGWKDKNTFPTLEFKLGDTKPVIYLSLKDLIIEQDGRKYVCLMNGTSLVNEIAHPLVNHAYVFGSMVLKSFYVALNSTEGRVGFAPLKSIEQSDLNCLSPRRCYQGQVYNEASNFCREPNCDAYYFMTLNEQRHECQTHPIASVLLWGIVGYLVFVEFYQFVKTNRYRQQLLHNYA